MYHCVGASHGQRNDTFILSRALHSRGATHAPAISPPLALRASPSDRPIAARSEVSQLSMARVRRVGWARSSVAVRRVTTVKRNRRSSGSQRARLRRRGAPEIVADGFVDDGWLEWGGELIWAVGFTEGGAPFGLRVSDFDPADLEAMGLPGAAWSEIAGPAGWLPEPDAARGSDDARAHLARGHVR